MKKLIGQAHSVWSWHDEMHIWSLYCSYLLKINVCLVSKDLVCLVFSNFCKLREKLRIAECL